MLTGLSVAVSLALAPGCAGPSQTLGSPEPAQDSRQASQEPPPGARRVLLIGASYFACNDMAGKVRELARTGKKNLYLSDEAVVSGKLLRHHRETPSTLNSIKRTRWDEVVMCDAGVGPSYESLSPPRYPYSWRSLTRESLQYYVDEVKKVKAKPLFIVPWAFEDGMTWLKGWGDTYEQMQTLIDKNTAQWAKEMDIAMVPVGPAFREVLKVHKEPHYLYATDFSHPSARGSYLMACTLYASLYGESPEGLAHPQSITDAEATEFQRTAWAVVKRDWQKWNLSKPRN
jgi:hypothetical protein